MSEQQNVNNPKISGSTSSKNDKMETNDEIVMDSVPTTSNKTPNLQDESTKIVNDTAQIGLSPESSEENLCRPDWLKARDSLETFMLKKTEKIIGENISNSKSTSFPSQRKSLLTDSPHSEPEIGNTAKNAASSSISKVLTWDPWEKLGRKNKDIKKKKEAENLESNRMDCTSGDEIRPVSEEPVNIADGAMESYVYEPYHPRSSKSVEFTNEVLVVYINADKIVGQSREPLKKELEQQIRNKEMRRGHSDEYMQHRTAVWSNKKLAFQ